MDLNLVVCCYINAATRSRLLKELSRREYGARSKDERDAISEATACLAASGPEYLGNIIPQDHPDRVAAARIIAEML